MALVQSPTGASPVTLVRDQVSLLSTKKRERMTNTQNNDSGWIKIHRSILKWEWYDDVNTRILFFHLLVTVNHEESRWHGITINRGQRITSISKLAKESRLTVKSVRVALEHLKRTQEVAYKGHKRYSVITVTNYDRYQTKGTSEGTLRAQSGHTKGNKQEYKEEKEILDDKSSNDESKSRRLLIDYILKLFFETYGTLPTDRSPRNIAWNFIRNVSSFKQKSGNTKSVEDLLAVGIATFRRAFPDTSVTSLDTVRRHAKSAMDTRLLKIQKTQYDQQS